MDIMKTIKDNLFDKVISSANLKRAILRSSLGKRGRKDVQEVLANMDKHIAYIQDMLKQHIYPCRPKKAIRFYDSNSGKERIMIKPDYKYEQIIHHALVQVMQSIFMKGMYEYSCGSIPNRGCHKGKKYLEKCIRDKNADCRYVLKLDIRHYYQSVDIELIKQRIRKYIKDEGIIWLFDAILDSNKAELDGEIVSLGLPVGYYTSQWLANWFLQDLDHAIKEKLGVKIYVRYLDDMVLMGSNKKQLHRVLEEIREILKAKHLEVKKNYQVFKFHYVNKSGKNTGRFIDFMGFRFYRNRTTMRRRIMLKATRKAKRIAKKQHFSWYEACQMVSYIGWFEHTDTRGVYLKYIKPLVNIQFCKRKISRYMKAKAKEAKNANDNLAQSGKREPSGGGGQRLIA